MVVAKNSSSYVYTNSSTGFISATYAKGFQTLIDAAIESKYWQTKVNCYPAGNTYSPSTLSDYATKTATSVGYVSSNSYSQNNLSGLGSWLSSVSGSLGSWTAIVRQSLPYINYKISCMSETDYKAFVAAVIEAGGLSDYEQTNTPVQA